MNDEQMREYIKANKLYPSIELLARTLAAHGAVKDGEWTEFHLVFRAVGERVEIDQFALWPLDAKEGST